MKVDELLLKKSVPIGNMGLVYKTYIWLIMMVVNVGKYTVRPMDPIGLIYLKWNGKSSHFLCL